MIELLVLFLGIYGALATPCAPHMDHDLHHHVSNDAELADGKRPGLENLNEKMLPISRLFATEISNLPANKNLAERSQIPSQLPGTGNLAEKRIPEVVLKRLSKYPNAK